MKNCGCACGADFEFQGRERLGEMVEMERVAAAIPQ